MFKFSSIITVFFVILLASGSLLAQNLGKVKATISDMPDQMTAGQSAKVTVTITNTGKNTWTNENIYSHELGVFEIKKSGQVSGNWNPVRAKSFNIPLPLLISQGVIKRE